MVHGPGRGVRAVHSHVKPFSHSDHRPRIFYLPSELSNANWKNYSHARRNRPREQIYVRGGPQADLRLIVDISSALSGHYSVLFFVIVLDNSSLLAMNPLWALANNGEISPEGSE